jgi:transcriptional regulator with XRE-family HTH domain
MKTMTIDELKRWRAENGYSQAKLAKALCVASMTVSRWEMGIRSIPPYLHLALEALRVKDLGTDGHNISRKEV